MSASLTCGVEENVPSVPGACATRNFAYLVRGPWSCHLVLEPVGSFLLIWLTEGVDGTVNSSRPSDACMRQCVK